MTQAHILVLQAEHEARGHPPMAGHDSDGAIDRNRACPWLAFGCGTGARGPFLFVIAIARYRVWKPLETPFHYPGLATK